jgi:2'-5' RNA ligase
MKYYLAIVPPLVTKERIFDFQKSFPSNKVPLLNEPHITLKSRNGLTEDKAWLAKIMTLIGNYPRFQIHLEGVESFGDEVLFLKPSHSEELLNLHMNIISLLNIDEESRNEFYEGLLYHPHLTLGATDWGGMSKEELEVMKLKAKREFEEIPPFQVDFVRVLHKNGDGDLYKKLLDIPLKL